MSLTKQISVDRIEIFSNGVIQIHVKTIILEDQASISESFHQYFIAPGDDYAAEDDHVKAICAATHTADVVSAYQAAQAAQGV
jgi:hypothetical protein